MVELAVVSGRPVAEIRVLTDVGASHHVGRARRAEPALDAGGLAVEMEGMMETLKAVRGIADALERKETNAQLRERRGRVRGRLGRAALAPRPPRSRCPGRAPVAGSIRVKPPTGSPSVRDRDGGKASRRCLWGSEQGPKSDPNRFAVAAEPRRLLDRAHGQRFGEGPAPEIYRRAVYEIFKEHGLALVAGPGNILIKIGADAGQAVRELGTADKALGSTMTTSEKMGATRQKGRVAGRGRARRDRLRGDRRDQGRDGGRRGPRAPSRGAEAHHGRHRRQGQERRRIGLRAFPRATGVTDDELRPAMETLVTATGDVGKAQKDMKKALDISAASGKSVEDVSKAIALAHTGPNRQAGKAHPGPLRDRQRVGRYERDYERACDDHRRRHGRQHGYRGRPNEDHAEPDGRAERVAWAPRCSRSWRRCCRSWSRSATSPPRIPALSKSLSASWPVLAAGILAANAAMKLYAAGSAIVKAAHGRVDRRSNGS